MAKKVRVSWEKAEKKHGITTKSQMAELLQYPQRHINRLYSPTYNPRIQELAVYAARLGMKVSDLIKE